MKPVMGVVAFAFGAPWTIRSNRQISELASLRAKEFNCSVYTQLDVRIESGIQVEYTKEEPGSPPPTLRIARGAVEWARQREIKCLMIVAAQPHLLRALRDIQRAVLESGLEIAVRECKEVYYYYSEDSWFCSDSIQDRVRSRQAWEKRELILRLMPFFIYKHVAS